MRPICGIKSTLFSRSGGQKSWAAGRQAAAPGVYFAKKCVMEKYFTFVCFYSFFWILAFKCSAQAQIARCLAPGSMGPLAEPAGCTRLPVNSSPPGCDSPPVPAVPSLRPCVCPSFPLHPSDYIHSFLCTARFLNFTCAKAKPPRPVRVFGPPQGGCHLALRTLAADTLLFLRFLPLDLMRRHPLLPPNLVLLR